MSLDQLQPYFGLRDRPFRADLAPSALHRSGAHQEAKARIAYLVQAGALGLITGEVGSGKTTALRAASAALDASRHTVIYLPNPAIGARGIYAEIIARLGGTPRFHKSALIPQAQDLLLREREERKKRVLLIIDEAHLLSRRAARGAQIALQQRDGLRHAVRRHPRRPATTAPTTTGSAASPRWTNASRCATSSPA